MLDIVMPIHKGNFDLAVRREIQTKEGQEYEVFLGSLVKAVEPMDMPFRVIISAEGGTRSDLVEIESFLRGLGAPWQIAHNDKVEGYEKALCTGLSMIQNPLVAVVPPWYVLDDRQWFGKMQAVFLKDGRAMLVGMLERPGVSSTVPPARFDHHHHPAGEMFLTKNVALKDFMPPPAPGWLKDYSRAIHNGGGTRWECQGIRFDRTPHLPHQKAQPKKRAKTTSPAE